MNQNIDDGTWQENSLLIKTFLEKRIFYEQLCQEVAYILEAAIEKANIEYSAITYRPKTLKSFLEKILRKTYNEPLSDITDFAGVRLVFLYNSDFSIIEKVIDKNFKILEKVDKLDDKGVDKFGYGAIHYIVQLSKKHSGARYDNLKNLVCEIQVRTVLQDSWSIIDHHLVYKNESAIPKHLRRKLNSLAGLFETADDQFNQIKNERSTYIQNIQDSKEKQNGFLDNELNIDSFEEYLKWKFPKMNIKTFKEQVDICFSIISENPAYLKLKDIDRVYEKNKIEFNKIKHKLGPNSESSSAYLAFAIGMTDEIVFNSMPFAQQWREILK